MPLALLALLAALGYGTVRLASAVGSSVSSNAAPPLAFERPSGPRTTGPRCLMVLIDQSKSMADSDSQGMRADAVEAAAEFVAKYGLADDRIGVTWFADVPTVVTPLHTSIDDATRLGADPPDVGDSTQMTPALDETRQAMASHCDGAQPVILLVTDGAAGDALAFAEVADRLREFDPEVHVHLIAMNGDDAYASSRTFWEDPTNGLDSIREIDQFGRDEVADAVADVLMIETGQRITPT